MPEGDSVYQVAAALRPLIVGRALAAVRTRGGVEHPLFAGRAVDRVETRGKNLLIIAGDHAIRVHLGMYGAWFTFRPDQPHRRSGRGPISLVIVSEAVKLVCYHALRVELLPTHALRAHKPLARLGPDLIAEPFGEGERAALLRRARRSPAPTAGELLLDQAVACGVGNIFKCETLFICRLDPWTPPGDLPDAQLLALYDKARELLLRNRPDRERVTTGMDQRGLRLWVYGRRGPCLRCRADVQSRKQGDEARTTWFCPSCQPAAMLRP
jgi:endonuclease-8